MQGITCGLRPDSRSGGGAWTVRFYVVFRLCVTGGGGGGVEGDRAGNEDHNSTMIQLDLVLLPLFGFVPSVFSVFSTLPELFLHF